MKISSCVTFFGNCRKAMNFYSEIFEVTEVKIVTFGDKSEQFNIELTPECRDYIYRAELNIKTGDSNFSFIMSDSPVLVFNLGNNDSPNNRDNLTFDISSSDKEWIEKTYGELLKEGKRNTPLQSVNHKDDLTGSVMDKFGICWILNYCS